MNDGSGLGVDAAAVTIDCRILADLVVGETCGLLLGGE
jgi:hypothetical protein